MATAQELFNSGTPVGGGNVKSVAPWKTVAPTDTPTATGTTAKDLFSSGKVVTAPKEKTEGSMMYDVVARPLANMALAPVRVASYGLGSLFKSEKLKEAAFAPVNLMWGKKKVQQKAPETYAQAIGQGIEGALMLTMPIFPAGSIGTLGATNIAAKVAPWVAKTLPAGKLATFAGKIAPEIAGYGSEGYLWETSQDLQDPNKSVGEALKPGLVTALGAGLPLAAPLLSKATGKVAGAMSDSTKQLIARTIGVEPETITLALTRPTELANAQAEKLSRVTIGQQVLGAIRKLGKELSDTGSGYNVIRDSADVVSGTTKAVLNRLKELGIDVDNAGRLVITKDSPGLSPTDINGIEGFLKQFGDGDQLTGRQFMNAREALDSLSKWNSTMTDSSKYVVRQLRKALDEAGKAQLTGLRQLDETYKPLRNQFGALQKDYLVRDANGVWQLKDNAANKIANLLGKGKSQLAQRLRAIAPDIEQKIQLLRAIEDIESAAGNKVGTYLRGGAGGFIFSGGNPVVAFVTALLASPAVAIPMLIRYGQMKGVAREIIENIIQKIVGKKTLTPPELDMYKKAVGAHMDTVLRDDTKFWNNPSFRSTATGAGAGSLYGFEKDENGNIQYNVEKGLIGAGIGGAIGKNKGRVGLGVENVTKNPDVILETLSKYDDLPITIRRGKATELSEMSDDDAILSMLKTKMEQKSLTQKEIAEAGRILAEKKLLPGMMTMPKANLGADVVAKGDSLASQAKGKTLEEFVKGQGTPVYRGNYARKQSVNDAISTSLDRRVAESFAENGKVEEMFIPKEAKIVDISTLRKQILGVENFPNPSTLTKEQFDSITGQRLVDFARKQGYDVIDHTKSGIKSSGIKIGKVLDEQEMQVVNPNILKTRSQLTDIWKKANEASGRSPI